MSFRRKAYFENESGQESRHYDEIAFFCNGFASVKTEGKGWGYIDEEFNEICELKYDIVFGFNEYGFAAVKKDGKWGFINKQGREICEIKYSDVWNISPEGVALVCIKKGPVDKYGFVDTNGEEVCEVKYDYIEGALDRHFSQPVGSAEYAISIGGSFKAFDNWEDGVAIISLEIEQGLVNKQGKVIAEPQYSKISSKHDENEKVYFSAELVTDQGTMFCLLDTKGNKIRPFAPKQVENVEEWLNIQDEHRLEKLFRRARKKQSS